MNILIRSLFPDLPNDVEIIESINNPVRLPFGGRQIEMQHRFVKAENGQMIEVYVCRIHADHEYILYHCNL